MPEFLFWIGLVLVPLGVFMLAWFMAPPKPEEMPTVDVYEGTD